MNSAQSCRRAVCSLARTPLLAFVLACVLMDLCAAVASRTNIPAFVSIRAAESIALLLVTKTDRVSLALDVPTNDDDDDSAKHRRPFDRLIDDLWSARDTRATAMASRPQATIVRCFFAQRPAKAKTKTPARHLIHCLWLAATNAAL